MAEERISSYIDLASLKGETDEFLKLISQLEEKLKLLKSAKVAVDASTTTKDLGSAITTVNKSLNDYNETLKKVEQSEAKVGEAARKAATAANQSTEANKQANNVSKDSKAILDSVSKSIGDNIKQQNSYKSQLDNVKKAQADLTKEMAEAGSITQGQIEKQKALSLSEAELKQEIASLSVTIKSQIKDGLAAEGSYDSLNQRLGQLRDTYRQLSESDREGDIGTSLLAQIEPLDAELKKIDASLGNFQRNVGNYKGAFTDSLQILQKELDKVGDKMIAASKDEKVNGDQIERLQKEYKLLQQLVDNSSNGFTSAMGEIKANTKALQQLEAQGLKSSAAYKELFAATADLKDETGDLKAALKNAAPDDVAFNAAADAARGLVGIYGLAQSASAIFGDENKALQETLVKLQAAETALQSIEAVRALFKKENSVRQAINIGLQKIEVLQTNLQTAAESKNIVVKNAAVVAQKALNAVMSIGAGPLAAILGIIGLLVISMTAFGKNTENSSDKLKDLNSEIDRNTKALDKNLNAIKNSTNERIAALKAGFAEEKKIREEAARGRGEEVDAISDDVDKNKKNYDKALKIIKDFATQSAQAQAQAARDAIAAASGNIGSKVLSATRSFFSSSNKITEEAYDEAITIRDKYQEKVTTLDNKESEDKQQSLEDQRASSVEEAKLQQNILQIKIDSANTAGAYLQDQLSDETTSYEVRAAALRKFLKNQTYLIELERKQQLSNPELQGNERDVINNAADQKILQATRNFNKAKKQLDDDNLLRVRQAELNINETRVNMAVQANARIIDNDKKGADERLSALEDNYELQSKLIQEQLNDQLLNLKLNEAEKKALAVKAGEESQSLLITYGDKQIEIVKQNAEKETEILERERQKKYDALTVAYDDEKVNLNNALANKFISIGKYLTQRKALEDKYTLDQLNLDKNNSFSELSAAKARYALLLSQRGEFDEKTKKAKDAVLAAAKDYAAKEAAYSEASVAKQIAAQEFLQDKKKELISSGGDFAQTLITAQFEKQKNDLADEQARNEDVNAREIELNAQSAASEEDKANRVILINARAQQQKEAIARRQKQIDIEKARFDKAANIAQIIASTAAAVIETLKTYKGTPQAFVAAAIVGAIGALQLAKAVATPIPKYKDGTRNSKHPGGFAVVGDGGVHEAIKLPSGEVFLSPDTDTMMDLPRGTEVFSSVDDMDSNMMALAMKSLSKKKGVNEADMLAAMIKASEKYSNRVVAAINKKTMVVVNSTHNGVVVAAKGAANYNQWHQSKTQTA